MLPPAKPQSHKAAQDMRFFAPCAALRELFERYHLPRQPPGFGAARLLFCHSSLMVPRSS